MSWSCVFDSLSINICQSASAASVNVTARCSSTRLTLKTTSTANDRSHRWLRCTLCNSLTIKGYDRCKFLSQDPNQPAWARAGRTPQVKVICILLQIKSYSMWKKKSEKKKKKSVSFWLTHALASMQMCSVTEHSRTWQNPGCGYSHACIATRTRLCHFSHPVCVEKIEGLLFA